MKIYEANGNRFILGEEKIDVIKMCREYECDGYLQLYSHQMKVFNADGSKASLCVNGLHCFAHDLYDKNPDYRVYALLIGSEVYKCEIESLDPFISKLTIKLPKIYRNFVDVGNDHMICFEEDKKNAEIYCQRYMCNINYVKVINRKCIEVITYEKGVGFTKSCGSGNVASSYYCYVNDLTDSCLDILNPGGICSVRIKNDIEIRCASHFVREI